MKFFLWYFFFLWNFFFFRISFFSPKLFFNILFFSYQNLYFFPKKKKLLKIVFIEKTFLLKKNLYWKKKNCINKKKFYWKKWVHRKKMCTKFFSLKENYPFIISLKISSSLLYSSSKFFTKFFYKVIFHNSHVLGYCSILWSWWLLWLIWHHQNSSSI